MSDSKSTESQNKQADHARTEADKAAAQSGAGKEKDSHNNKSHTKAGSHEGAGGGAKQQHRN
jgi:hypothetical protein